MLAIALYQPEIPPNTGNIIRLCANTGATLHLIHPLGFDLNEKQCRRAGLDYHELSNVHEYPNYNIFIKQQNNARILACTTKALQSHTAPQYQAHDIFLFGPETRGLPAKILDHLEPSQKIRIPMRPNSRSLNLSNAAAIILYEGLRQLNFPNIS